MFISHLYSSKALPSEFRHAAEELFPPESFGESRAEQLEGKKPSVDAAKAFSIILGIDEDYKKLWDAHNSGQAVEEFLYHFQNNLDLLIQKTWVEKADEERKEKLQDRIPVFIDFIEKGSYSGAIKDFGGILEELAYLFFGLQSQKEDFAEYALRIDTQMGLFWWYAGQIKGLHNSAWVNRADGNILFAMLLLGLCYLTNF